MADDGYLTGAELTAYATARRLPPDWLGMACIAIFEEGPPTPEKHRTALNTARNAIRQSFAERLIPTPPGGWRLAALHPTRTGGSGSPRAWCRRWTPHSPQPDRRPSCW